MLSQLLRRAKVPELSRMAWSEASTRSICRIAAQVGFAVDDRRVLDKDVDGQVRSDRSRDPYHRRYCVHVYGITAGESDGASPVAGPAELLAWRAADDDKYGAAWGTLTTRRIRLASSLKRGPRRRALLVGP